MRDRMDREGDALLGALDDRPCIAHRQDARQLPLVFDRGQKPLACGIAVEEPIELVLGHRGPVDHVHEAEELGPTHGRKIEYRDVGVASSHEGDCKRATYAATPGPCKAASTSALTRAANSSGVMCHAP